MSQQIKNVIVVGAGGNLGPLITKAIEATPSLTLSILSRASSKSTLPSHIKVHTVPDDYPADAVLAAFKGQDAVIDLLPPGSIAEHKALIDYAVQAGVKRFIPSEFGSKTEEPSVMEAVPMFGAKVAVWQYLKEKEKEGLSWTGVSNGGFFDMLLKTGWLGFDLANHKGTIYDSGDTENEYTLLSDVGKATVGVLLHPAETVNRYVYINTFQTSQNAVLKALEGVTGKKWEIDHGSAKAHNEEGNAKIAKGDYSGAQGSIMGFFFSGNEKAISHGADNELLLGRGTKGEAELKETIAKILKGEEV